MNDEHDNEAIDKEMLARKNQHEAMTYPYGEPEARFATDGVVRPNPIHTDRNVQHIDIRLYFNLDADREGTLNDISQALQDAPLLCDLVSAYELKNNGFGHLLPDDKPLA